MDDSAKQNSEIVLKLDHILRLGREINRARQAEHLDSPDTGNADGAPRSSEGAASKPASKSR